jgi:hypothetical protein
MGGRRLFECPAPLAPVALHLTFVSLKLNGRETSIESPAPPAPVALQLADAALYGLVITGLLLYESKAMVKSPVVLEKSSWTT